MTPRPRLREKESGNVMFFILLAIVALAALSFAITEGGRDTGQNMSSEKQRLLATGIIDYGDTMQKSVQLLRLRGIQFSQLSFAVAGLAAAYGTPGAAPTAEIFNDAGAAALYQTADAASFAVGTMPYAFTAGNEISNVGTTCGAADCTDLLMLLPGLAQPVCTEIDSQLGIGATGNPPPSVTQFDLTPYAGNPIYAQTVGDSSVIAGKTAACVLDTHSGSYTYYQVLLAR